MRESEVAAPRGTPILLGMIRAGTSASTSEPRARPQQVRAGRGALALVALLALAAAVLVWRLAGASGRTPRPTPTPVALEPVTTPAEVVELRPAERLAVAPQEDPPEREPRGICRLTVLVVTPTDDGAVRAGFDGSVQVRLRGSDGNPERTLTLTSAQPRAELECPSGEYEFTLEHRAERVLGALPVRTVLEANTSQTVTLALVRLKVVAGTVSDAHGKPIADVPVQLERRGRAVVETDTRAGGRFVFPAVPLGDYELIVGDPLGPLIPPRELDLAEQEEDVEVLIPVLLELEVRVLDGEGRPVAGARVDGAGNGGGHLTGETGKNGSLRARSLPAGRYQITVSHPTLGRGREAFELVHGRDVPLEVRLHPDSQAR